MALGPLALMPLWSFVPVLRRPLHITAPSLLLIVEAAWLFAKANPDNPCTTKLIYLVNQLLNGLIVGMLYSTMAVGLTLIYSVQRIVSFAHGQFVMFGGIVAFVLLGFLDWNPIFVVPIVALASFAFGAAVARVLLRPVQSGTADRSDEFALLMTFGFGLFLSYILIGALGSPSAIRAPRYTDRPLFAIDTAVVRFSGINLRIDLLIAGGVGLVAFILLAFLLYRTWLGRSLRAVAMDREAAAVAGIDTGSAFVSAFGIGTLLAGVAGAALVPVFNFQVPEMASETAIRSYVIVVLGGLGSVSGALLGGLVLGMAEALTVACYPDPSKGAIYQVASGLLVFLIVLLIRPQGFFGRSEG
jgi:branched-chain amino acid transport system permease protein